MDSAQGVVASHKLCTSECAGFAITERTRDADDFDFYAGDVVSLETLFLYMRRFCYGWKTEKETCEEVAAEESGSEEKATAKEEKSGEEEETFAVNCERNLVAVIVWPLQGSLEKGVMMPRSEGELWEWVGLPFLEWEGAPFWEEEEEPCDEKRPGRQRMLIPSDVVQTSFLNSYHLQSKSCRTACEAMTPKRS